MQASDFDFPAGRLGLRSDKGSKKKGSSESLGPERDGMWKRGRGAETNRTRKHEEGGKKKRGLLSQQRAWAGSERMIYSTTGNQTCAGLPKGL